MQVCTTSSGHFTAVFLIEVCVSPTETYSVCILICNKWFDATGHTFKQEWSAVIEFIPVGVHYNVVWYSKSETNDSFHNQLICQTPCQWLTDISVKWHKKEKKFHRKSPQNKVASSSCLFCLNSCETKDIQFTIIQGKDILLRCFGQNHFALLT